MKDILREIQTDIMANRIMVMHLARAVGMLPDTLKEFQEECIKQAKKEIKKQDREEKKESKRKDVQDNK